MDINLFCKITSASGGLLGEMKHLPNNFLACPRQLGLIFVRAQGGYIGCNNSWRTRLFKVTQNLCRCCAPKNCYTLHHFQEYSHKLYIIVNGLNPSRSISNLYSEIIWVRVVLERIVVGD